MNQQEQHKPIQARMTMPLASYEAPVPRFTPQDIVTALDVHAAPFGDGFVARSRLLRGKEQPAGFGVTETAAREELLLKVIGRMAFGEFRIKISKEIMRGGRIHG